MATLKIIERVNIDTGWVTYSLGDNNGVYFMAIKNENEEAKLSTDPCAAKDLKYIRLDVGIDSGVTGKPLILNRLKLSFDEFTSDDRSLDRITAFARVGKLPSDIYLKVSVFSDGSHEYTSGSMPVDINICKF